jgi:hypothetical protein
MLLVVSIVVLMVLIVVCWYDHQQRCVERILNSEDDLIQSFNVKGQRLPPMKEISTILNKWDDIIKNEKYGSDRPEFTFQRAEGFRANMERQFNLQLAPFPSITDKKQKQIKKLIKKASAAKSRKDKIEKYTNISKTYTNDTQNVHDHTVNTGVINTYSIIKKERCQNFQAETFDDILRELSSHTKSSEIIPVMSLMSNGLEIINLREREDVILTNIWNRAYHPNNAGQVDNIHEAIADALADCNLNGSIVCGSGRVNRIIGSLATLDYNPTVGNISTGESYKNEAFDLVTRSLNGVIKKYESFKNATHAGPQHYSDTTSVSDGKLLARYAESFSNMDIDDSTIPAGIRKRFESEVLSPVDEYIKMNRENLPLDIRAQISAGVF